MLCLRQTLTENSFSRQEEMVFSDCDSRRQAKLSTLLRLMAVVAGNDYDARNLTYERLQELKQVFLLSRVAMRIHQYPKMNDVLTVTTWEDGAKAAHVRRNYEMTNAEGISCISAKSEWLIVNPETRRILRPSTFTAKKFLTSTKQIDCPSCRKINLPSEDLEKLGERKIVYSDLDGNGHLFSGRYGDIIWDALPECYQNRNLREFYINYSKEAVKGETLQLVGHQEGDTYRVEGLHNGERCFTSACVF